MLVLLSTLYSNRMKSDYHKRAKDLEAILTLVSLLLIISLGHLLSNQKGYIREEFYLLIIALGFCLTGILLAKVTSMIVNAWMWVGKIIGIFISTLVLVFVYFLVLTPFAWLSRIYRNNRLPIILKKKKDSYYVTRNHLYRKEDLEKLW